MTEIPIRSGPPLAPGKPNLRDLGGLPAAGGARVREGRLFRGPALHALTPEDAAAVETLGIARVVDFRGVEEAAARPVTHPAVRHALSIEPSAAKRLMAVMATPDPAEEAIAAAMEETYRDFVRVNAPVFARFLALLAEDDAPLLFHCTAGKDRTGFAAALVLTLLGVERETIEQDYLASNALYRPDPEIARMVPEIAHAALFRVAPRYLAAALEELERAHGGVAPFADAAMGGEARRRAWIERMLA